MYVHMLMDMTTSYARRIPIRTAFSPIPQSARWTMYSVLHRLWSTYVARSVLGYTLYENVRRGVSICRPRFFLCSFARCWQVILYIIWSHLQCNSSHSFPAPQNISTFFWIVFMSDSLLTMWFTMTHKAQKSKTYTCMPQSWIYDPLPLFHLSPSKFNPEVVISSCVARAGPPCTVGSYTRYTISGRSCSCIASSNLLSLSIPVSKPWSLVVCPTTIVPSIAPRSLVALRVRFPKGARASKGQSRNSRFFI